MDPFEEFEFKPITDGLGFHKKKSEDIKKLSLSRDVVSRSDLPESIPEGLLEEDVVEPRNQAEAYKDLMKTLSQGFKEEHTQNRDELELSQPLPRSADTKASQLKATTESAFEVEFPDMNPSEVPSMTEMPDFLEDSSKKIEKRKEILRQSSTQRGASNSPKPSHLIKAPVSFSASILDFVLVIALAGVFLVSLLLVTQVELGSVLFSVQSDVFARASIIVLLVAVMQMYVVVSRSFFGRTLGEWTFDHQMGSDSDIESPIYPIKIVWRSLFTVCTGLVLMPLLSFIFSRDLSAKMTGVQLYKQR